MTKQNKPALLRWPGFVVAAIMMVGFVVTCVTGCGIAPVWMVLTESSSDVWGLGYWAAWIGLIATAVALMPMPLTMKGLIGLCAVSLLLFAIWTFSAGSQHSDITHITASPFYLFAAIRVFQLISALRGMR
jgi:hypothetical protein